jgi:predicted RNase H-like nuclease (RuvC/YqgF family)
MALQDVIDDLSSRDEAVEPQEFAELLKSKANDYYTAIYSSGYGAGKTSVKDDLETTKEELDRIKNERQELEERLDRLDEEEPDFAEERRKLEASIQQLRQEKEEVEEEASQRVNEYEKKYQRAQLNSFGSTVASALKANGVDEKYADFMVERELSKGDRIRFNEDEDAVLLTDENGVPMQVPEERDKASHFAGTLISDIDERFISDERANSFNTNPNGGGSNVMRRERFDQLSPKAQSNFMRDGGKVVS